MTKHRQRIPPQRKMVSHKFGKPILLLSLLVPVSLQTKTPEQWLVQLQQKYERIQSFRAQFNQIFVGRNVRLQESGIVLMKKPGKMYWEYQNPTQKFFVADGDKSYFYIPADNQVIVSNLQLEGSHTPLLFLMGKGNLEKGFDVQMETGESPLQRDNLLLRLTSKNPQGEFSHLILEFSPSSSLIHRLIIVEPLGNRNEYVFTNLQENVRIPERQFKFEIPDEAQIVYQ